MELFLIIQSEDGKFPHEAGYVNFYIFKFRNEKKIY
jgi:hypothetical protein